MDSEDEMDLFGDIDDIFVLSADSIYIADDMPMHVRQVNASGKVVNVYGSRGLAPEELSSMSTFTVNSDGSLVVSDYRSRRFKVFSSSGDLDATHAFDNVGFPRRIRQIDSGEYVILVGRSGRPVEESRPLFAHVDREFSVISKFGMTRHMQVDTTGFVANFMDYNPGYFDVHQSSLVYVPPVFEGRIYYFEYDGSRWSKARFVETSSFLSDPIAVYDPDDRPTDALLIRTVVEGDYAAKILSRAIGVLFTSDKTIALFYILDSESDEGEFVIRMEEYSVDGELLSSARFRENGAGRLSSVQSQIEVGAYHDGLFYLIDSHLYPRVRAMAPSYQKP
ncbi:MAG: hypothetical protein RIE53_02400 [Rhodothermales bacterium]